MLVELGTQQGIVHAHQRLALTYIGAFIYQNGRSRHAAGFGTDGYLFPSADRAGRDNDARQGGHGGGHGADGGGGCGGRFFFGGATARSQGEGSKTEKRKTKRGARLDHSGRFNGKSGANGAA